MLCSIGSNISQSQLSSGVIIIEMSGKVIQTSINFPHSLINFPQFSTSPHHCHLCHHCLVQGPARGKGERRGVIITRRLLEQNHHRHQTPTLHLQESHHQATHKPAEGRLESLPPALEGQRRRVTHPIQNPCNLTLSYLTSTPIRSLIIAQH